MNSKNQTSRIRKERLKSDPRLLVTDKSTNEAVLTDCLGSAEVSWTGSEQNKEEEKLQLKLKLTYVCHLGGQQDCCITEVSEIWSVPFWRRHITIFFTSSQELLRIYLLWINHVMGITPEILCHKYAFHACFQRFAHSSQLNVMVSNIWFDFRPFFHLLVPVCI